MCFSLLTIFHYSIAIDDSVIKDLLAVAYKYLCLDLDILNLLPSCTLFSNLFP